MDTSGYNVTPRQVAPSRSFKTDLKSDVKTGLAIADEIVHVLQAPGDKLNILSGQRFRELCDQLETPTPYTGVVRNADGRGQATDVPNPDSPDGSWDPTAFMPRFVFDEAEDALPVSPDFDHNTELADNAANHVGDEAGHYQDGVIGGDQKLSSGFTVTKKGAYTVLTYGFYYTTNKAGEYHSNDYSTTQIYLLPGPDGKLAPAYIANSWHYGSVLTPWKDVKKDADGRAIVGVNLGSHALELRDHAPAEGLSIRGDGQAELGGKPIDQSMSFDVFQKNVKGARYLDPATPEATPRLSAMSWGAAGLDPFLPEVYEHAPSGGVQLLQRGESIVKKLGQGLVKKADHAVADAADTVKDVAGKAKGLVKSAFSRF
jgi:hypothetical protein